MFSFVNLCPLSPPPTFFSHWSQQYDFSLERRSVRWGIELAEARAAEARAQEAAAKQETESRDCSQVQDIDGGGGNKPPPAAEDQDFLPPALNPVLAGLSHDAILTPLPAPSFGPRKAQPSTPQLHSLNLADFEREEDPFDKLELKTLDDKEELRNILQSQTQPLPPPSVSPPVLHQSGSASRGNSPSPPSVSTSLTAKPGCIHKPNGLVALLDMDSVGPPGRAGFDTDDRPCNIRSLSFPKLSDSADPEPRRYSPLPVPVPQKNVPNGSPSSVPRNQIIVVPETPNNTKSSPPKPVSMTFHFCLPVLPVESLKHAFVATLGQPRISVYWPTLWRSPAQHDPQWAAVCGDPRWHGLLLWRGPPGHAETRAECGAGAPPLSWCVKIKSNEKKVYQYRTAWLNTKLVLSQSVVFSV